MDLTIAKATALIEKMVSNQGWNKERSQPRTKGGMHTVKETDMLATKLELLLKKLDEGNLQQMHVPVHAMNSYSMCEVCGDGGHLGKKQPTTIITTPGSVHKEARSGVKHAHHSKVEVTTLTQISIQILIRANPP